MGSSSAGHRKITVQPLVSILIPAFNAEAWIADTIHSALGQTWPRKEIIVVDDGSRDQTLAIARQFVSREVAVVTQANQGAAAARNRALALSRGDYIQWLDADDLLDPNKIAKQVEALSSCPSRRTLLSSGWGQFMYRVRKARFTPTLLWRNLAPLEWLLVKWEENLFMQPATWLVSKELCEMAGPWDTRLSLDDDGEYFCRVVLASDGIRFIPEAKVFYRRGFESLSWVSLSNRTLDSLFLSTRLQIQHLCSFRNEARVRSACLKALQRWLMVFYPHRPDIVQKLECLAEELGGNLAVSPLPWKYRWMRMLLGWRRARNLQIYLPRLRRSFIRKWDRIMLTFERMDKKQ